MSGAGVDEGELGRGAGDSEAYMKKPFEDRLSDKPFEELVERLTRRFERDPELQFEIRQELRTHLEDCAAEFAASGMKPDAAQAEAKKALGNEDEIADQLWQANRRRLKVRKAAKWAAGLTIIPAAGASAIAIGWGALSCLAIVASSLFLFAGTMGYSAPPGDFDLTHKVALSIAQVRLNHVLSRLTPPERTLFDGPKMGEVERLEWSRNIAESHGNDPVYWANYAIQAGDDSTRASCCADSPGIPTAQALEIIDRAQQTEPDNALYPMMKASALINPSFKFIDPPSYNPNDLSPYLFAVAVPGKKHLEIFGLDPLEISDPTALKQRLQQLHVAAGKPYFQSHILDLSQRRLELLPRPSTLADWAISRGFETYQIWPHLSSMRTLTDVAEWAAYQAPVAGDAQKARGIISDTQRFSILAAQHSPMALELLVADGMYEQTLVAEAVVERQLKETQKSQAAIQATVAAQQFRLNLENNSSWQDRGDVGDFFAISSAGASPDAPPSYAGDYELTDRLMLSVLEMVLLAAAIATGIGSVGRQWWDRRRAALLFIGWKRAIAIALIATLSPVAVYGIYANFTPLGGRQVYVELSFERLLLEYSLVAATVLILLRLLTNRAVRKRAKEIGDSEIRPSPVGWIRISIGSLLGVGSAIYFFLWQHAIAQPTQDAMNGIEVLGASLGILVLVYGVSWLWWRNEGEVPLPWWNMVRPGLGCVLGAALLAAAAWIWLASDVRDGGERYLAAATVINSILGTILTALGVWQFIVQRRVEQKASTTTPRFGLGLATAPVLAAAALCLGLAVIPLNFEESHLVSSLNEQGLTAAISPGWLTNGRWQALADRFTQLARDEDAINATAPPALPASVPTP